MDSPAIIYGIRWDDTETTVPAAPGASLWRVRVRCKVARLVVFNRLLGQVDRLDPTVPAPEVASLGGGHARSHCDCAGLGRACSRPARRGGVSAARPAVTGGTAAVRRTA